MKRRYKLLRYEDRKEIERMWKEGFRTKVIAKNVGVTPATIYGELKRGTVGTDGNDMYRHEYSAEAAQQKAQEALKRKGFGTTKKTPGSAVS